MTAPDPSNKHEKVEFKAPESLRDSLDRVAYEQSSPGNTISRSDVLREAARDYVRKHDREPSNLHPRERGSLDFEENTVEEGNVSNE